MASPANRTTDIDPKLERLDTLVRAHQGAVRTFLRRLTRNSALADELAQEVFLSVFRKSERLDTVEAVRPWLYRLAYRRFLDHHRRETRRRDLNDVRAEVETPEPLHPGTRMDVAAAMDALPPERRACALLCLAQGHSHAEVATITGLPLGTVKSHVNRARTALKESLKEYQNE